MNTTQPKEQFVMQPKSVEGPSSQRASFLDSYRGIACLMVCFCHADINLKLAQWTLWGFTGVHLFFIISGYLIFQPFLKSMLTSNPLPSLPRYYQNRFVRIMPPYLMALIVYIGLRLVTHTNIPTPTNVLTHALLVFNYASASTFYSINPVLWTLAIEAQFYLLLPIIVLAVCRTRNTVGISPNRSIAAVLIIFFVCGVAARGLEFAHFQQGQVAPLSVLKFRSIFSFLDMFSIGMAIAFLEKSGLCGKIVKKVPPAVPLCAGAFLIVIANYWCSSVSPGEWMNSNNLYYTLFFAPIICIGFGLFILTNILYKNTQKNIFNTSPFVSIGLISYSVYLYHTGVEVVVFNHLHLNRYISNWTLLTLVNGLIALPFVLLASLAMYLLVEKPSIQWLKRKKDTIIQPGDIDTGSGNSR